MADFLNALGLKVVPQGMKSYDPRTMGALMHFAKLSIEQLESPDDLALDE